MYAVHTLFLPEEVESYTAHIYSSGQPYKQDSRHVFARFDYTFLKTPGADQDLVG